MIDYTGKTVVVTGAASGIGAATARALVTAGAKVYALDVKDVLLDGAHPGTVDLRDPASIDAAVSALPAAVDALFNCAGLPQTFGPGPVLEVNFLGLRHLTEAVIPKVSNPGAVACVASVGGLGWPDIAEPVKEFLATRDFAEGQQWVKEHPDVVEAGYRFSKACVIVYVMQRSLDLLGRGIRINAVSPGDTSTPMTPEFRNFYGADFWDSRQLPMGRPAEPEEQASTLLFINSGLASYLSGTNIIVDGGATAARVMKQVATPAGLPGTKGA